MNLQLELSAGVASFPSLHGACLFGRTQKQIQDSVRCLHRRHRRHRRHPFWRILHAWFFDSLLISPVPHPATVRRSVPSSPHQHGAAAGQADRPIKCTQALPLPSATRLRNPLPAQRAHVLLAHACLLRQACQQWEKQPTVLVAPTSNIIGDLHAAYQVRLVFVCSAGLCDGKAIPLPPFRNPCFTRMPSSLLPQSALVFDIEPSTAHVAFLTTPEVRGPNMPLLLSNQCA